MCVVLHGSHTSSTTVMGNSICSIIVVFLYDFQVGTPPKRTATCWLHSIDRSGRVEIYHVLLSCIALT